MVEYIWDKAFQRKLLYLCIRKPELREIIQAQYFTRPIHMDIARLVLEAYEIRPEAQLTAPTVRAMVKGYLGKKRTEIWPTYKREIKKIFSQATGDDDFVLGQAIGFAQDRCFRTALRDAEEDVNRQDYETTLQRFEQLRQKFLSAKSSGLELPVSYAFRFLAQEEANEAEDHIVFPIVPKEGAVLVYGLPKELKSWFAIELAVAVASGRKALGHFVVPHAAKTLYIQVEDRPSQTRERLALVSGDGTLRKLATIGNLRIVPRCPLNLMDAAWLVVLEAELEKYKPKLVVLDVLRRLFRGNISDSKETAEFLRTLDHLRDIHHCAILLVHHARKNNSSDVQAMALGSVNLTAWADVLVYTTGKRSTGRASVADLQIETKSSLLEESGLEIVVDSESDPVVRVRAKGSDEFKLVQSLIEERPGLEQRQIREKSRLSDKRLRVVLKAGVERGLWREERGKGAGNRLAYFPAKPSETWVRGKAQKRRRF